MAFIRLLLGVLLLTISSPAEDMVVTLLGTGGGPIPRYERLGISTLVEAGGQKLLFERAVAQLFGSSRLAHPG